jgi:hypothetical protein
VNYTLSVQNVPGISQATNMTGVNGQVGLRVPVTLAAPDGNTPWRYEQSGGDLGTAWRLPGYDDSWWPMGPGLLGYCEGELPESIRTQLEVGPMRVTYYFRQRFRLQSAMTNALLRVRPIIDDGAVFYVNGSEMLRLGVTNNPVYWTNAASRTVGRADYEGPFDFAPGNLVAGTNVLAVEVHQSDPWSEDVVFGAALEGLVLPTQVPITNAVVTVTRSGSSVILNWTEAMILESAANIRGPWAPQAVKGPVTLTATNGTKFFRLRQ